MDPRSIEGVESFLFFLRIFVQIWSSPHLSAAVVSLMTKITKDSMSDKDLKKRIEELTDFYDRDLESESFGNQSLLHNGTCTREEEKLPPDEMLCLWENFK